ncbi:MAG: hypothetical protein AAGH43_09290 [Pseudomonadota bacterium]
MSRSSKALISRRFLLAGLGVATLGAAGCQVRPLYGDAAPGSSLGASPTRAALAGISIDPPADRVTQLVRNELFFGVDSGAAPTRYRLALRATSAEETLGVSGTGAAFARSVRVTATYQLFVLGEDQPLASNTVFSNASYDSVEQRFANQRAAQDAQARAAREVAAIIEAQLAAALAG